MYSLQYLSHLNVQFPVAYKAVVLESGVCLDHSSGFGKSGDIKQAAAVGTKHNEKYPNRAGFLIIMFSLTAELLVGIRT